MGSHIVKDAKYWLPILGYYTGARLGELVQLQLKDIVLEGGHPYLDLNDDAGSGSSKHIKSEAGVRQIPIHSDVFKLGFGEFVAKRSKSRKSGERLFREVGLGKDGQASTQFSKFFARLMDKVDLSDPTLTFHSFRHGAIDAFRAANLAPYTIDAIIGHSSGKVSAAYGNGPCLEQKAEAIANMKLPLHLPSILLPKENI